MLKKVNDLLGRLSTTNRFSNAKLINPESVLEHTAYVSLLSLFIAKKLEEAGEIINYISLYEKALLHDVEESVSGDVITPTKYANKKLSEALKEYELVCANQVLKELPGYPVTLYRWKEAKDGRSGYIVRVADKLAVVYKLEQEILQFGNRHLAGSISSMLEKGLEDLKEIAELCLVQHEVIIEIINEGLESCRKISRYI